MIDSGSALAVMGNHYFNAIAWFLPDPANRGEFLRPHYSKGQGEKNRRQHAEFLNEVESKTCAGPTTSMRFPIGRLDPIGSLIVERLG
jgi:hypothetical protein